MFVVNATCKKDNLTSLFMVVNDWCDLVTRLKNFIQANDIHSNYSIYKVREDNTHYIRSFISITKDKEYVVCNFETSPTVVHSSKNYLEVKSRI